MQVAPVPVARRYSGGNGSFSPHMDPVDDIQALKSKALQLVARQVTVWLLETQHECTDTNNRVQWSRDNATKCFEDVVERLFRFKSYSHALSTLSASLGDDNVQLAWFVNRPLSDNLRRARDNYAAWDPPPNNDEWAVEEVLLHELSERFNAAKQSYVVNMSANDLGTAVGIARLAATNDTYSLQMAVADKIAGGGSAGGVNAGGAQLSNGSGGSGENNFGSDNSGPQNMRNIASGSGGAGITAGGSSGGGATAGVGRANVQNGIQGGGAAGSNVGAGGVVGVGSGVVNGGNTSNMGSGYRMCSGEDGGGGAGGIAAMDCGIVSTEQGRGGVHQ
jgi:hypothetical protein